MRTMINATLAFGAVFVPVGVATAAKREEIKFRTLHAHCGTPIKKNDWCPKCEVKIAESSGLTKGWEYAKDTFLHVNDEEMAAITVERSQMIELSKFIAADEIDKTMVERSYFLTPNQVLYQPYELLASVLQVREMAGIGRATLWGKEFPVAVETAATGVLMLRYLFCSDELRSGADAVSSLKGEVDSDSFELLGQFIDLRHGALELDDLTPNARQKAMLFLEAKARGAEVKMPDPTPPPAPTGSVIDVLREMVAEASVVKA